MGIKKNVEGCNVNVINESKRVSNSKASKFVFNYLEFYLFTEHFDGRPLAPIEARNKEDITALVKDNGDVIEVYINDRQHIEINANGYHDMKLMCEQFGNVHGYFFKKKREYIVIGKQIMNHQYEIIG